MITIEWIQTAAEEFALSQGWRPYDTLIELDCHLPPLLIKNIVIQLIDLSNILNPGSTAVYNDLMFNEKVKFAALRMPNNIMINLVKDPDKISISLTKKEPGLPKFPEMQVVKDEDGLGGVWKIRNKMIDTFKGA